MTSDLKTPSERTARTGDVRLGEVLRRLRHERGLTLVQVAQATGLSHPFISQLEHGKARPSMRSLYLIALALGTTQQRLLALAAPPTTGAQDVPVRGRDADMVPVSSGGARLLLHDDTGLDVTEFVGVPQEMGDWFRHDRHELLYVAAGTVEVEVRTDSGTQRSILGSRDSIGYPGLAEHRFRQVGPETAVLLLVHSGRPGTAPQVER